MDLLYIWVNYFLRGVEEDQGKKLNYCTISHCQNTFVCEVDMPIAHRNADTKIWTNTGYLNRSVNALATVRDTWHYRIIHQSLVRHRIV